MNRKAVWDLPIYRHQDVRPNAVAAIDAVLKQLDETSAKLEQWLKVVEPEDIGERL